MVALQGVLEEFVQAEKAPELQADALTFIADQVAALVESSEGGLADPVRQSLTQLMQSATHKLQVGMTLM